MVHVICNKCKGGSLVELRPSPMGQVIEWKKVETVISGRERLDGQFGWQCSCGNNSLLSEQEERVMSNPVNPTPQEIDEITKNLEVVPAEQFKMVQL